jgi:hypothetical protein
MVYGILIESIVQCFILEKYDKILLQQIEEYTQCSLSHLNLFDLYDDYLMITIAEGRNSSVKKSELQIWSLQISNFERIPARNCMLTFLEHHQSNQHG